MLGKALVLVAVLVVAGLYFTGNLDDLFGMGLVIEPLDCQVLKPLWGFYRCEISSAPIQINKVLASPPVDLLNPTSAIRYQDFYCNFNDIAPNAIPKIGGGFASCSVTVNSENSGGQLYYKICQNFICGNYILLGQGPTAIGQTIYLEFGEYATFQNPGVLFATSSWALTENYYQQQLVYRDWFGFETQTIGVGCDIRSVLTSSEWGKLPKNAKLSLNLDERQNFVSGWQSFPKIGNVFDSPLYGDNLICTPQHQLYEVNPYQTADSEGDVGTYYDNSGSCYLTPGESPIASVACCPGEQLSGQSCNSNGEWVSIDVGECCIGGLCSAINCQGGGGYVCDLSENRAFTGSTCNSGTGMCEYTGSQYASCCPPDKGCAGDSYCDIETYTCKTKVQGLNPCNFECCDQTYHPNYQEKRCATGICCPNSKTCASSMEECGQPVPIIPSDWLWIVVVLFAVLFGAVGYMKFDIPGAIAGTIIGVLVGWVLWWFLTLDLFAQVLLGVGLVGGMALLGYLAVLAIPAIVILLVALRG